MAAASYPPSPPPATGPTREFRAATTFVIAATFMLIVLLLIIGANPVGSPVRWAVALVGPIVLMVVLFATSFALGQRATWAVAAMTPLLYLLVVSGAISFVIALTRSTIEIPIGLILAIWALSAPPSRTVPMGAVATLVTAVALAAALWVLPSELLVQPGGPLIVDEAALQPSLEVTCAQPLGADPATIHVTYDWRWLRTEPWPGGQDFVEIEAFPDGPEDGLAVGFTIDPSAPVAAGIWQEDIGIGPPGITYGIDLAATGFGPQVVEFSLIRPRSASLSSGVVNVRATYRHGSASSEGNPGPPWWTVETSATCEW